jgi:cytochrome b
MNSILTPQTVRIWDLPTRLFHWLLMLSVAGLITTGELAGEAMFLHFWFGYAVLTLVLFRLVWGVVGGHWSRFVNFIPKPAELKAYLLAIRHKQSTLHAGHNPLGALSIVLMLLLLFAQVFTGFMSDDEIATAGPWVALVPNSWVALATQYHGDFGKIFLIVLIVVHVATVLYYKRVKNSDLITPMLNGNKELPSDTPQSRDTVTSRLFALGVLLASAYVVYRLVHLA